MISREVFQVVMKSNVYPLYFCTLPWVENSVFCRLDVRSLAKYKKDNGILEKSSKVQTTDILKLI